MIITSALSFGRVLSRAIIVLIALHLGATAYSAELVGIVVGVIDGDTLDVLSEEKELYRVRVSGIDAPEKRQPFGQAAKQAMSDLTFKKTAVVTYSKRDRYGRIIGLVRVGDIDSGLRLVRSGLAWHYKQYSREQDEFARTAYAEAEVDARREGLGLWGQKNPVPPWEWRRKR